MLPTPVHYLNLALAFVLELAVLAAAAYAGFSLPDHLAVRLLLGLGAPLVVAAVWGIFGSPKAVVPLRGGQRAAFEVAWFGAGAVALALAGRTVLAVVLAVACVVNRPLLAIRRREERTDGAVRDDVVR